MNCSNNNEFLLFYAERGITRFGFVLFEILQMKVCGQKNNGKKIFALNVLLKTFPLEKKNQKTSVLAFYEGILTSKM